MVTRRDLLRQAAAIPLGVAIGGRRARGGAFPTSGRGVPGLAAYDELIPPLMRKYRVPGGAVAVVKDGRLVMARGYGYADRATGRPVEPDALFRVASLSKPITAAAALLLHQRGKLDLDARAFALCPDLGPPPGINIVDPRVHDVTIRHLLWHAGGWDRAKSFDPMFRPLQIASGLGLPPPADTGTIIRFMLSQPLEQAPGTAYAYSNFGYAVLGRIIERLGGAGYERFVRENVLAPAGAKGMRLGRSRREDAAPGEVAYHNDEKVPSVFPGGGRVAFPYGGFYLEAMDSHGGWLASTADYLRFVTAVDGRAERADLLAPETIALMTARPPPPIWARSADHHYGMGWLVRPGPDNWWHMGALPGTATLVVRGGGGASWAAFFDAEGSPGPRFQDELDATLWRATRAVTAWPAHDLFA